MTYDNEEWRPVVGWEGLYEVSSHGRVRSFDRVVRCGYGRTRTFPGRILKGWLQQGYPVVALMMVGEEQRRTFVHILVCEAFHGPAPSPDHEVAHNDGDRANGYYRNLRWATHVENEADKIAHGTRPVGERHGAAKLTPDQVLEIRAYSGNQRELADRLGVSPATICVIRKGKNWRHLAPEDALAA